jgi:putative transposase
MPSIRVSLQFNQEMHFATLTIKDWQHILAKYKRWDILANSLQYCQKHKHLKIYAYVFMTNHIHLIIKSLDVSGFLRDFKKHTAYELMKNIKINEPELVRFFKNNDHYSIWEKTNMPKMIESEDFFLQKKNYIEENPVRKGEDIFA